MPECKGMHEEEKEVKEEPYDRFNADKDFKLLQKMLKSIKDDDMRARIEMELNYMEADVEDEERMRAIVLSRLDKFGQEVELNDFRQENVETSMNEIKEELESLDSVCSSYDDHSSCDHHEEEGDDVDLVQEIYDDDNEELVIPQFSVILKNRFIN